MRGGSAPGPGPTPREGRRGSPRAAARSACPAGAAHGSRQMCSCTVVHRNRARQPGGPEQQPVSPPAGAASPRSRSPQGQGQGARRAKVKEPAGPLPARPQGGDASSPSPSSGVLGVPRATDAPHQPSTLSWPPARWACRPLRSSPFYKDAVALGWDPP